jgi:hypothetical protein
MTSQHDSHVGIEFLRCLLISPSAVQVKLSLSFQMALADFNATVQQVTTPSSLSL